MPPPPWIFMYPKSFPCHLSSLSYEVMLYIHQRYFSEIDQATTFFFFKLCLRTGSVSKSFDFHTVQMGYGGAFLEFQYWGGDSGSIRSSWAIRNVQGQSGLYKTLCQTTPKPEPSAPPRPKLYGLLSTLIMIIWCSQGCNKMLMSMQIKLLALVFLSGRHPCICDSIHITEGKAYCGRSFLSFVMSSISHG